MFMVTAVVPTMQKQKKTFLLNDSCTNIMNEQTSLHVDGCGDLSEHHKKLCTCCNQSAREMLIAQ